LIERGGIFFIDLDPTQGREQRGHRPVFIITTAAFNAVTAPLVAPVTTGGAFARHRGFAVPLAASQKVQGVVLCNQLRTIDLTARNGRFVEQAPADVVDEVMARVATLIA
jgi:mRNA-degrading endonuclease toxin of MazEF toxin-antitoxin module